FLLLAGWTGLEPAASGVTVEPRERTVSLGVLSPSRFPHLATELRLNRWTRRDARSLKLVYRGYTDFRSHQTTERCLECHPQTGVPAFNKDTSGRLQSIVDATSTTITRGYDAVGRLSQVTGDVNLTLGYNGSQLTDVTQAYGALAAVTTHIDFDKDA